MKDRKLQHFTQALESIHGAVSNSRFVKPRYDEWRLIRTQADFDAWKKRWRYEGTGVLFRPDGLPYPKGGENG